MARIMEVTPGKQVVEAAACGGVPLCGANEQQPTPSRILALHKDTSPLEPSPSPGSSSSLPHSLFTLWRWRFICRALEGDVWSPQSPLLRDFLSSLFPIAVQPRLFVVLGELQNHQGSCLEIPGFM